MENCRLKILYHCSSSDIVDIDYLFHCVFQILLQLFVTQHIYIKYIFEPTHNCVVETIHRFDSNTLKRGKKLGVVSVYSICRPLLGDLLGAEIEFIQ
jgi:hypothetical protein